MRELSITDTNILKGIAIVLLLCHHSLYPGQPYDDVIVHGIPLVENFGKFSKLCVAAFVFLSGYGLTVSAVKSGGIGSLTSFYRRRYVKLLTNYWVIYLLFVPLGVFVFNRSFSSVYGDNYWLGAISDFFGLHLAIVGHPYGYNATWWFYSCIIMLYLLYPLIWKCRKYWFLMIPFAVMFPTIAYFIPILGKSDCSPYFLAFVCGFLMAYIKPQVGGANFISKISLFLLLIIACLYRFYSGRIFLWDAAIIVIGVTLYSMLSVNKYITNIFSFLGKHSSNIFMFHTFIYYYYLYDFVYWSRNPLLIVLTLLVFCIPISIGIEWIKDRLQINQLQTKMMKK